MSENRINELFAKVVNEEITFVARMEAKTLLRNMGYSKEVKALTLKHIEELKARFRKSLSNELLAKKILNEVDKEVDKFSATK